MRNAVLGDRRKTFTLKHDPALHGFALLNMTGEQLKAVALKDPFTRYFTIAYAQTTTASGKTFDLYNNITGGEEINNMSEYLEIAAFFSSALEAAIGVNRIFLKLHNPQTSKSFTRLKHKDVFGHLEVTNFGLGAA